MSAKFSSLFVSLNFDDIINTKRLINWLHRANKQRFDYDVWKSLDLDSNDFQKFIKHNLDLFSHDSSMIL